MKLIGIAGPSSSGKSTLATTLEEKGLVRRLRMDDFYKNKEDAYTDEDGLNWEHPESMDLGTLYNVMVTLKRGKTAVSPIYDKKKLTRIDSRLIIPDRPIMCEGFLLYVDERIKELLDVKIYIDVDVEEQYRRRKARQLKITDEYFYNKVVGEYNKHALPTRQYADHILDGNRSIAELEEQMKEILFQMADRS